ncbi:MAG: hypothetical protein HXY50_11375 [Ignavibacteriaceae bacterium]|nr:hypothetical protein [Ignavibacteriaceae bacterium]
MAQLNDENLNKKISDLLKDLPKINAPVNFETKLVERITIANQLAGKKSFMEKIFSPHLIPSATLAATAVIIFLLLQPQFEQKSKYILIPHEVQEIESRSIEHQLGIEAPEMQVEKKQEERSQINQRSSEKESPINNVTEEALPSIDGTNEKLQLMYDTKGTQAPASVPTQQPKVSEKEEILLLEKVKKESPADTLLERHRLKTSDSSKINQK